MNVKWLLAFIGIGLFNVILGALLLSERRDQKSGSNPFGGPSWSWQVNLLLHAKYSRRGEVIRKILLLGLVIQGAVIWRLVFG